MFNFAIERGLAEANPAAGVRNPGGKEEKRDRALSAEENRSLWQALDAERPKIAGLFRLMLLTAQRKGEVAGMDWAKIDFESG
jgi:integrase